MSKSRKNKNKRYVCIHGHFYQPPRENPWLNKVEYQESAFPFHDWNVRINDECYDPNATSRILNDAGKVTDIYDNYARMSFNFGPTLLEWMEIEAPDTYKLILESDKSGIEKFGGHGPAMAQIYNHLIMPLANERDKETQVIWGIADFKYRFGRDPEGMWLSETAVNTDTLEVLAEHNIKFTILSPYQAKAFRKIGEEEWQDVTGARINPRRPYVCKLPSGKEIALFFYDGPASQAVAFEGLLNDGQKFADRLMGIFDDENDTPQLAHIATDGESYGHHHKRGNMALSYCLHSLEDDFGVELTVYGQYLEMYPPEYEVQIIENTSWSCNHGVERWKSDCGCNTGAHPEWNQKWRKPLRDTFDWIRGTLDPLYEKEMKPYAEDPWGMRNTYIEVILDRSEQNVTDYLHRRFGDKLSREDETKVLKLLEMQFHTLLMYTSCGWFFDEVTGIESMQDIFYAARTIQLAEKVTGADYENEFVEHLKTIPSNIERYGNAAKAYDEIVVPMRVDMLRVAAHYAVSSLFRNLSDDLTLYSFTAESQMRKFHEAGKTKLVIGKTHLKSLITREEFDACYAMIHLGAHQLYGGVMECTDKEDLEALNQILVEDFDKGRIYEMFSCIDEHFGGHSYSFWHLFKDDQRDILKSVISNNIRLINTTLEGLYENNYLIVQVYHDLNVPVPDVLRIPVELALKDKLSMLLGAEEIDATALENTLKTMSRIGIPANTEAVYFAAENKVDRMVRNFSDKPLEVELMNEALTLIELLHARGIHPDYRLAQNTVFDLRNTIYPTHCGDLWAENEDWCKAFEKLCEQLNLEVI